MARKKNQDEVIINEFLGQFADTYRPAPDTMSANEMMTTEDIANVISTGITSPVLFTFIPHWLRDNGYVTTIRNDKFYWLLHKQ